MKKKILYLSAALALTLLFVFLRYALSSDSSSSGRQSAWFQNGKLLNESVSSAASFPSGPITQDLASASSHDSEETAFQAPDISGDFKLIESGPAAGMHLRIPAVTEYADRLPEPAKREWVRFRQSYPSIDPSDTASLHDVLMQKRAEYPMVLSAEDRETYGHWLKQTEDMAREMVLARGHMLGIPLEGTDAQGNSFFLTGFDGVVPVYASTENREAAISTAASFIRRNPEFDAVFGPDVDGSGFFASVNDNKVIFPNPEFRDDEDENWRYSVIRGTAAASHATHVAGTIGARGLDSRAQGMAPAVSLYSFSGLQNSDVIGHGMDWPGRPGRSVVGNTSLGNTNSNLFAVYTSASASFDQAAFDTPYYLHFYSAGNNGTAGYFTVSSGSSQGKTAKNLMTVGSVTDVARQEDGRFSDGGVISSFSSLGPARDGRIKPDVVANGAGLYSPNSVTGYGSSSGTSMASPNAAGSAVLLQDYFNKRFPGHLMRAATLKTLMINSTDDLGLPGPDYTYGWGLVNVLEAAKTIKGYADDPAGRILVEDRLSDGQTADHVYQSAGGAPIRISLGWTDPPGAAQTTNTVTTPALVNNLNLKLVGPDNTEYLPYVMPYVTGTSEAEPFDPSLLDAPAVTGTNHTDNVLQVYIAEPPAGAYRIEISAPAQMEGEKQSYSLVVNGLLASESLLAPVILSHPTSGDGTESFVFEVIGEGFMLGADVIFRRDGFAPVYAQGVQVSGSRLTARLDAFAMAGGSWSVAVRNPDGQETISPEPFVNQRRSPDLAEISVSQRPGTKQVDLSYNVWSDSTHEVMVTLSSEAISIASLAGDSGPGVPVGNGKLITWDAGADWNGNHGSLDLILSVNDGYDSSSVTNRIEVDTQDYILTVHSAYGNPAPATGVHTYAWGAVVTCSVDSVVLTNGTNYLCTGWTGSGSIPSSGKASSTGERSLANLQSELIWNWTQIVLDTEWVEIGHPGNDLGSEGRGRVEYLYSIGMHAVSIAQFMTAYQADNSISDGDEKYWSSLVNSNAPATLMSWHEAARFCNWLTSGRASDGVYRLGESNLVVGIDRKAALEHYGTVYAMPTLNEWHKAAYYTGSGYSDYANGSDTPPFAGVEANYNPLGIPWTVGSGTVEQNGTFDMMGNVIEWTETPDDEDYTGRFRAHGGTYSGTPSSLRKSSTLLLTPTLSSTSYGLRVAAVQTSSTGTVVHNGTAIEIDFITVGNAGNSPDTTGKGAVDYVYQIGKHEVTIGEFMAARSADPAISNGSEDYWNKGSYSLGTEAPATTVTWHEAAKFCNWLTSGSASTGAYYLDAGGVVTNVDREAAALIYDTVYVIPTEDEWYKAAYWTGSGYSLYANGTDTPPVAHLDANYSPTDSPWEVTAGTEEQNGTFNMMGNVQEWSESITGIQGQYLLGGSYSQNAQRFRAGTSSSTTNKMMESTATGLRLVQLKLDADGNGLPDWWEIDHFGRTGIADPDGLCANRKHTIRQAYIGGFDPNAPDGKFRLSGLKASENEKVLNWNAVSGRVYSVYWTTNLLDGFTHCLESNIPWTRSGFTNAPETPLGYYKIEVQLAP